MTSTQNRAGESTTPAPRVTALYHPTLAVHDLEVAREWFNRVFQLPDLPWEETLDLSLVNADYVVNYSFFMFIKDFHFVVLCPELHARGALAGQTRYKDVPEGMIGIGWYTDDAVTMFERLAEHGFPAHDQRGVTITADHPPVSAIAPDILVGFTHPEEAGMRHEYEELGEAHVPAYSRRADPRLRPGWSRPDVDPADPLGIVASSHHTIVTADLDRLLRLYVDASGGRVVGTGENAELHASSTFVHLGDAVVEIAVPAGRSAMHARVADGLDHYLGITLVVTDLQRAAAHLRSVGLHPGGDDGVVTIKPEEAFGMEWRLVTARPYPTQD